MRDVEAVSLAYLNDDGQFAHRGGLREELCSGTNFNLRDWRSLQSRDWMRRL
jgi:hypothetical protein